MCRTNISLIKHASLPLIEHVLRVMTFLWNSRRRYSRPRLLPLLNLNPSKENLTYDKKRE